MANDLQPPSDTSETHCTDVERFLRIIHPEGTFEIRAPDCPHVRGGSYRSTATGYFNDPATAAAQVIGLESLDPPAVYVSVNPIADALLARAANRVIHRAKKTAGKVDVIRRRWLFVDIDAKRPSGISSTDDELRAALDLADAMLSEMRAAGWPEPLRGSSGNGFYLFWRIDLANDEAAEALVRRVLQALAQRFNTDGAEVDVKTFDANRICKVLGTVARKGDELLDVPGVADRPYRRSWFVEPDGVLQVAPIELLNDLAGPEPVAPQRQAKLPSGSIGPGTGSGDWVLGRLMDLQVGSEGDGSSRLFTAACTAVGAGLDDDQALDAIRRYAAAVPFPKDWSDTEILRRIHDARGKVVAKPRQSPGSATKLPPATDDPWDDPIPVDRPRVPPFPSQVLPEPLRAWVVATAWATQTPADLAGLLALAVCSGAVARRVEVEAGRGWREPVNLYVACLLDPASRKSAVFRSAMEPLRLIERDLVEVAGPDIARAQADRRVREAQAKEAEKKAAKGDEAARAEALQLAEELAAEPVPAMPKLVVDDATAEAIEVALAAQGGRLIVAGAEGGLFDVMGGRYSAGIGNLDVFLKGHAGDDLRVDRVLRGSLIVDRCCLTLGYAVQPEVIRGLAGKPSFRGRGLIGRFLYGVPETTLGRRLVDPEPVPDPVAGEYEALVRRLASIPEGFDGPWLLTMSPEARERFLAFANEVESMLGDDGRLASLRDWGGKLCGLAARLAGVLHLVAADAADPLSVPIGVDSIEAAITLARWAVPNAEAAIGLMAGGDGSVDDAAYVLRWLRERVEPEVSRREVHVHGRRRFDNDPERLDRALAALVDRGWLRPVDEGPRGPGRPSVRFIVHPSVAAGSVPQVHRMADPPRENPQAAERVRGVI